MTTRNFHSAARNLSMGLPNTSKDGRGDAFIDQSPVENITVEMVHGQVLRIFRNAKQYLEKESDTIDTFTLPGDITVRIEGTWFDANIRLAGPEWSYDMRVKRGHPDDDEGPTRIISRAGFLGHSSRFAEDFMTLKMTY